MKIPAKKIVVAILLGGVFLNAGFSFAQIKEPQKIYLSEDEGSEERKREFWEKFRESVTPREKNPPREERPKEVHPREEKPREVHPREAE
ncbi:MAG: hypothetical protein IJT73_11745 [Selenomonadaceae bacterium]|nr:hypothetical protein [Selenomonadaceae bacterium]